jgi:hypothetical protein
MGVLKYVNFPIFILSLAFGFFAVYIMAPDTRKIYVYPTPENVGVLQYRDKANTCFTIKQKEVRCPADSGEIHKIPPQH